MTKKFCTDAFCTFSLFTAWKKSFLLFSLVKVGEQLGEWTVRFSQSRNTRIAGPAFIFLGFIMCISSIVLCIFSRRANSAREFTVYTHHPKLPNQIDTEKFEYTRQRRPDVSTFSVVLSQEKSYFTDG